MPSRKFSRIVEKKMRKYMTITPILWLLLFVPAAGVDSAEPGRSPKVIPDSGHPMMDRKREEACACCRKCKAAQKPVKPAEEMKKPSSDGCEECCSRCGKSIPPHDTPPEIPEDK